MLGLMHGQPAVPTTLGKVLSDFAFWIDEQVRDLEGIELKGKVTGAVGNYNAHAYTVPM